MRFPSFVANAIRQEKGAWITGALKVASGASVAAVELETVQPSIPVEAARGLDVLLGKPEGAIISRIDTHR